MKKSATNTAAKASKPTKPVKAADTAKSVKKNDSPASVVVENYFEIDGEQVKVEDVVEKIRKENKGLKTLQTYFNFAERRCYYVADGKADGKFVEF